MQELNKVQLGPEVSIGIAAYGNHDVTNYCLNSLLNSAAGDFELILVDDCSPDNGQISQLFMSIIARHANTKVFKFTRNLEYSGSLNCILSHASGSRVMFVSNDIYVTPHYLSALLGVADSNAHFGIVRGVSNFVDNGKSTHNVDVTNGLKVLGDIPAFAARVFQQHGLNCFTENYLTGDAFLVTRDLLDEIGTFDPLFYGYFADHDYGIRAHQAGFKLAVASGAFAFHHQDANFGYLPEAQRQQKLQARWAKVFENWARFKLKYSMPVSLPYQSMNAIDWDALNSMQASSAQYYSNPGHYLEYLLSPPIA